MYPLVNPYPHFLVGDLCQVRGTTNQVVIKEINCNTGQTDDKHQWSYSIYAPIGLKTAWWKSDELTLIRAALSYPNMRFQTRRMSVQTQTAQSTLPAMPNVTGYPIGTVLHGNNKAIGNLWIITIDNSYDAVLLFDGRSQTVMMYQGSRRDTMSPGMRIAEHAEVVQKVNTIPKWAMALILTTHSQSGSILAKPSTKIPPQVIQQINKSFAAITPQQQLNDLGLTKPSYGGFQSINDDNELTTVRPCPASPGDYCVYKTYYGLVEVYEYCCTCDHKRTVRK